MSGPTATNAASSGIEVDRKHLRSLAKRSDQRGMMHVLKWAVALAATGSLVWMSLDTWLAWPAMFIYGVVLTIPCYALSHESAHGTAFRSRWLNEMVFWLSSLVFLEEPLHRRYTHTNHHTFTWHVGRDSQMPFDLPLTFTGWLKEVSGVAYLWFHAKTLFRLCTRKYPEVLRMVTPDSELPKMTRNARLFALIYAGIAALLALGYLWPLWYFVLPRLMATPVLMLFTLVQHVEMRENSWSVMDSTRSFRTNWLVRSLYMNMNHHIEHHLYPQVPFHALPELYKAVQYQLPRPDPGLLRTNWEVLEVVVRRTLGKNTRARSIRQAPNMITDGGYSSISQKTI